MNKMTDSCNSDDTKTSCSITDKGCKTSNNTDNLGEYWCAKYTDVDYTKLGWYEAKSSPTLSLIHQTKCDNNALIFNVGAGATTLIDDLLNEGYTNLIANDISSCALNNIKKRLGEKQKQVQFIVDDLVNPSELNNIPKVDIWNDRAVLHFFIDEKDQDTYFKLLKEKVKENGYVILAEFNLQGATTCSGLPVKRYDVKMFQKKLGDRFKLLETFDYNYTMPSGEIRKYVYALFKRV